MEMIILSTSVSVSKPLFLVSHALGWELGELGGMEGWKAEEGGGGRDGGICGRGRWGLA